ncbi:MAG: hypothetical protein K0Q74_1304 [Gammaproteobacteria bacterium]|nr:hypothetical protein [Gammaproteobacteria bacterium]
MWQSRKSAAHVVCQHSEGIFRPRSAKDGRFYLGAGLLPDLLLMVPRRGLEPPRGCPHKHLKLACLPIPPSRHKALQSKDTLRVCQPFNHT